MIISAFLVSTSFTVGGAIAPYLDPLLLTLIRFVLATLFLAPYILFRYTIRCSWLLFFQCAIISGSLVLFFWCMFLALRHTSPLNTSVIFTLVPSIAGVYAYFLLRERMQKRGLAALLFGLVGALMVIFQGDLLQLVQLNWNKGDVIFFAGCLSMGAYTVLLRYFHNETPLIVVTFWILFTGTIWLLIFGLPALCSMQWQAIPLSVWSGLVYLALFTTVITFFLTQYATHILGPTRVMAFSYLYPSFVLFIEFCLGKPVPGWSGFAGVLIVLAAMFVLLRGSRSMV